MTAPRGKALGAFVISEGQAELLHVVGALDAAGRLACGLHGGQQKPIKTAMMAMTTSSSISVKPPRTGENFVIRDSFIKKHSFANHSK